MPCPRCHESALVIKKGFFPRKNLRSGKSQRFLCKACRTYFSQTSGSFEERQKRPDLHRLAAMRNSVNTAVFDEMETLEHSKCKPVAIAVAVQEGSRILLSAVAASMPAKGPLATIARRRYGPRDDHRKGALAKAS